MGRYRHRPLHLFGGLGLVLGVLGAAILAYLTVLKVMGQAIGHRPLLTLGVLLVVVGLQFFSLGLLSEMVTSHHEERVRASESGASRSRRSSARPASLRVLYFGTYERDYPRNAQVISCLRDAGVEVIERHAGVWEGRRDNWAARWGAAIRLVRRRAAPALRAERPVRRRHRRLPRALRRAARPAGRRTAAARSSTRSSRSTTRSSPTAGDSEGSFGARGPRRRRPASAPASRTSSSRTPRRMPTSSPSSGRSLARASRVCLVGAEDRLFHAGWRPDEPLRVLFVGQADPAPRARDDSRGGAACARGRRSASSAAASSTGCWRDTRERRMDPLGRRTRTCRAEYWGAGCALGIFGTSDKAQRVIPNKAYQALACGTPADHRGHPRRARAAHRRGERPARPAGRPGRAGRGDARRRRGPAAGHDAAARQDAGVYEEHASEDVLGARWRSLIEELL